MLTVGGYSGRREPPLKYGEPFVYDPKFSGPRRERSSTDTICLVIFATAVVTWMAIGFWAIGASDLIRRISDDTLNANTKEQPIRDESDAVELVKFFKAVMLPVLVAKLLVVASAIGLVFTMRWIAATVTWTIIAAFHAFLLLVTLTGFYSYYHPANVGDAQSNLFIGIAGAVNLGLCVTVLSCAWHRIKFSIALIKESSRAVSSMWSTVFFPIIPAIFRVAVIQFTIMVAFALWALKDTNTQSCSDGLLNLFLAFNLFACVWLLLCISALCRISLAGAFGTWFWTDGKRAVPFFVMTHMTGRAVRYHSGTAALGGLLIAICSLLRTILSPISRRTACARCNGLSSTAEFLKRINRSAFIVCAIHGKGLCASAMSAHRLAGRNVLRLVASDMVTGMVFGFCKLLMAGVAGWLGWIYFSANHPSVATVPVAILCISAYFIAGTFFNVHAMAVDTMVLCALEDAERNDGSVHRPYHMSRQLMKILVKDSSTEIHRLLHHDHFYFNHH